MNVSALQFDSANIPSGSRAAGDWRVFGHFATVEAAKEAAARLAGKVDNLRVQMIDGVTLLGRG